MEYAFWQPACGRARCAVDRKSGLWPRLSGHFVWKYTIGFGQCWDSVAIKWECRVLKQFRSVIIFSTSQFPTEAPTSVSAFLWFFRDRPHKTSSAFFVDYSGVRRRYWWLGFGFLVFVGSIWCLVDFVMGMVFLRRIWMVHWPRKWLWKGLFEWWPSFQSCWARWWEWRRWIAWIPFTDHPPPPAVAAEMKSRRSVIAP